MQTGKIPAFAGSLILTALLSACGGGGGGADSAGSTSGGSGNGNNAGGNATLPGVPQSLVATPGNAQATLNFSAPASDGGSPVLRYAVSCSGGGTSVQNTANTPPVVVTGLSNGTAYQCTVSAVNAVGSGPAASVSVTPQAAVSGTAFQGSLLLGAPSSDGLIISVLSASQNGSVAISYGRNAGIYEGQTVFSTLQAGTPARIRLSGLQADQAYYYRLQYQAAGSTQTVAGNEYSFRTARSSGQTFSFTIQADSHLDENSDLNQYQRTLMNVLADKPDFHIDLGDTFMTEKHTAPFTAVVQSAPDQATVRARYAYERGNFGLISHSVPLFLANGNHEGEAGWLNNGTAASLPVWATLARQEFFANPAPDSWFSGDPVAEAFVGLRQSWYAWQWGDAQFIVLDPYWNSMTQASRDGWNLTLGDRQYQWLTAVLAASKAKFKFIFLHNLVGGLDGQMRGGIEAAPFYEWGGKNADGTDGFAARRPGWAMPVHALLVKNKVTAVFHGHDHLYAKQILDGIVYQEVPQPSAVNTGSGASLASTYHYNSGTILSSAGHIRVTVTPTGVKAEYVRAWLPAAENASRKNAQIDDSWTVAAP
ncbi:fibronectin type III domain-containing protein [Undibacterium squillarum]|uniref:Fibronectin type-III domain-containing protein n=1 Tax=Undibacterium squillarum TaxID=1131567 RepID=A0ABQ2XVB4_9BURK|nr:fibronectin type III domain-containing protein [Undibacterium squillarum]GGX34687.1 hypothetical protein GCM10010946_09900 [Undibacterium squillarum]